MRHRFAAVVLTVLLVGALTSAAGAAEDVLIRTVDVSGYPRVDVTVAGATDPDSLVVSEDGVPIEDAKIVPFAEAKAAVDVVLTIDTSGSMVGEAMDSAINAATSFINGLPDHVRVGVVAFSSRPSVLVPLTNDRSAALDAVSELTPDGETALYDAVGRSARLFRDSVQRNIVLLSDGGDTASARTLDSAVDLAAGRDVAIFSVGIEGSEQDVGALRRLSRATGGTYAPAEAAELTEVYESLATDLAGQVLVSYESEAPHGSQVPISVSASNGVDSAVVLIPDAPADTAAEPQPVPAPEEPLLTGAFGMIVVLGSAFLAIFLVLFWLLGSREESRRDEVLGRRFGVRSSAPVDDPREGGPGGWIPEPIVGVADQLARTGGISQSLEIRLQRSGWKLKVGEFLAGSFLGGVGAGLLASLLFQNVFFVALAIAAGVAAPFIVLGSRTRRRLSRLHAQLPDILMIMASSLRAGHSFLQALAAVAQEAGDPGASEFERMLTEVRLGRPITTAMNELADRVGSPDFRWAVLAVDIQRDIGGNLSEVLDTVAQTLRERDRVRRQVEVLSTEGRMSIYILAGIPIAVALYMAIANPDYIGLLFTTTIGLVMLTFASALLLLGIFWMRRVVRIRV